MVVGILYICTGKYNQFFSLFYESMQKNFLPNCEKKYFVWSDQDDLTHGLSNVFFTHKECGGFPADSLFRFYIFLQAEDKLKNCDYLYYINANANIIKEIGSEILPDASQLVAVEWPVKYRLLSSSVFYHYERNPKSLAYVKPFDGPYKYYMGGLNGGTAEAYLTMIHELSENIKVDYSNGIIACSNDESHLNRYLHDNLCKVLPYGYCWPEEWNSPSNTKILFRNKIKLDSYFNKGRNIGAWGRIERLWYLTTRALRWYVKL